MPGEEIKLGPFVGGLNSFSDPTAIDDLELALCENFDMYPDGTLVNRPPMHDLNVHMVLPVSSWVETRRNRHTNPINKGGSATGWFFQFYVSTFGVVADVNDPGNGPMGIDRYRRLTFTQPHVVSAPIGHYTIVDGLTGSDGENFPVGIFVRSSKASRFFLTASPRNGGVETNHITFGLESVPANEWTLLEASVGTISAYTGLRLMVSPEYGSSWDAPDTFEVGLAIFGENGWTGLHPIFHGDSADTIIAGTDYRYGWVGTDGASASIEERAVYSSTMKLLGWYITPAGAPYLIGSDGDSKTYYFDGTSWALITDTISAAAMTQYRDKAWLVAPPGSTNPGGKWSFGGVFEAVATMPKGRTIVAQKERLWIGPGKNVASNGSRIYFCAPADPDTWDGDFITINTGDGQNVIQIMVYFQDLLIFKNDSTYRFSYDIDPALGTVSRVSDTVGTFDTGCVTTFENRIFVLHNSNFYELSNYNYERLNDRVPFVAENASAQLAEVAGVSYFANRLFISFYDKMYVWSVRTRTWSTWASDRVPNIGKIFAIPGQQENTARAYTYSRSPNKRSLFRITDGITTDTEPIVCKIRTKNYDYQSASRFKRLFLWGLDCIARQDIVGRATPVEYSRSVTWGQLKQYTWGQLKNYTWGRLLGDTVTRVDAVDIGGLSGQRKFIKLGDRSLRFRQIGFEVDIHTDGDITTAPAILFNLNTWVSDKQSVVKRIS